MHALILVIISCAMLIDFLIELLGLPPLVRFLPEFMSGIVLVYVLVVGTIERFRLVAPKYWLFFAALVLVVLCGVMNSNPGAGPVISGIRVYFRGTPLFLLAAVLPTSEEQLKRQLKLVLGLAFIQLPIAGYQRWMVVSEEKFSGDSVQGTLMDSGILSMFLICAAVVLTGLLLKRRIGKLSYAMLLLILLIPTTINETKATVIFLPLGLFVTLLVCSDPGKRMRYAGLGVAVLLVFGAIFVPVYNALEERNHYKVEIVEFFTNQQQLDKYLIGTGHTGVGTTKAVPRGEAIVVSIRYLAKDPALLAFGLGLGNVSPSTIGKSFQGSYYGLFQSLLVGSLTYFVLELGLLGVALFALLFWMVFMDSLSVARGDKSLDRKSTRLNS